MDPGFRELVNIVLTRGGTTRKLDGERIGPKWNGLSVHLPSELEATEVPLVVRDLERAFEAMRYGYLITRTLGIDAVPETEQQAAIAELNEMGLDVEVSADRKQVSTNWRPGASRPDAKTAPEMAKRMMPLIQSLSGTRQRVEVLAVSPDFASDAERYMPR